MRRSNLLHVVDDGQNQRDARALMQAQQLIGSASYDAAFSVLEPLAARPTTSIQAQGALLLAALLTMQSRAREVLEVLERVPDAGVVVDRGFFLMLRAQASRMLKRTSESVRDARASCAHGDTPARLLVLADCCGSAGEIDEAIAALERASLLAPDNVAVHGQLAGWLAVRGDKQRSDAALARVHDAFDDGDADHHRNAAFAYACRGDVGEAKAALTRALQLEPDITRAYVDDEAAFAAFKHTLACGSSDTQAAE